MLRIGLIGYGAWGGCHSRVLRDCAQVAGVAAASEKTRACAATETGAPVYSDYRELLADDSVEAVDVVVPNYLHEQVALDALAAGKHVLLEKPMALTVEGCDRIIEAARKSARVVLVGHELHFSPLYAEIKRLIDAGRIGTPRYVLVDLWRRPYRAGSDNWKQDPARVGSWILEEPVHYFDLLAWYLEASGTPETVFARGNRRDVSASHRPGVNDNFSAMLGYAGGAYGIISQSLSAVEHHLSVKVFGSEGVLRSEWHAEMDRSERPSYSLEISEGGRMTSLPVEGTPGELFELRAQINAFCHAVRRGAALPFSLEEARRAVALCLAAEQAIETGGPVKITS